MSDFTIHPPADIIDKSGPLAIRAAKRRMARFDFSGQCPSNQIQIFTVEQTKR
jgi:hypothetical protein